MLSDTFFNAISQKEHVGLIKFKCGEELEVTSNNLQIITKFVGGNAVKHQYKLDLPNRTERLVLDDDWIPEHMLGNSSYTVVSAKFTDMAWIVSQVAQGIIHGSFFDAQGNKLIASAVNVKLCPDYDKNRQFMLRDGDGILRLYTAPISNPDICKHGQTDEFNIIDFVENYE